ncbi:MAG: excinuclease ABC subunit UvrA, partial [Patescibacteria group bacterium]
MKNSITIKGARVHNLKNVSLEIPRDKLVVITGLSGSGKSSLAFDTIYAEGQRRYVESLSAYARQFIGLMDKPDVDLIEGLSPAISIDQKSASSNPRSTVGTVTEIYDYLRLLYARIGDPHCPKCGNKIKTYTVDEIVENILKNYSGEDVYVLAPLIKDKKGEHKGILINIKKAGFTRIRYDKGVISLEEAEDLSVDKNKRHTVEIVIDRLAVGAGKEDRARLAEAVEKALDLANGLITIYKVKQAPGNGLADKTYSRLFACPDCGLSLPEIEPRLFSFNNPHGACPECGGIGTKLEVDPSLVLNQNLTIAQGAIRPWSHGTAGSQSWLLRILGTVALKNGFDLNTPIKNLSPKQLHIVLYGTGEKNYNVEYQSDRFSGQLTTEFEGVIPNLERRYKQTESDYIRKEIEGYMRVLPCPACEGRRLKPEALAVKIDSQSIHEVASLSIDEVFKFFVQLEAGDKLTAKKRKISNQVVKEIKSRLQFLLNVGLSYLTLSRAANTLSGGEAQRIRLATQIGSQLMGVLYILDEPSIGLHQRDNTKLISTLMNLRDLGNTVIVVEHDEQTIEAADYVVDVGPGAGEHGGEIVAAGTLKQIIKSPKSITGHYLSGKKSISAPKNYRPGNGQSIKIFGASENNLKNLDVEIPLGKFTAITGVSGSGKSTLMDDILSRALAQKFYRAKEQPGKHDRIEGTSQINKVINIDQSPIGRTPRS